jgi:hypothetical protein
VQTSLSPRLADLQQGQANLQGDITRGNDMYTKYAANGQAAVPVIQAQQQSQMGIRDQALQLAQQQIDAEKAATAAKNAHDLQMQNLLLQTAQANAQSSTAKAAKAAAAPKPKAGDILNTTQNLSSLYSGSNLAGTVGPGGRTQTGSANIPQGRNAVTDDMMMAADESAAFNHDSPNFELAKIVAQKYGLSPDEAAAMITPGGVATADNKSTKALTPPTAPDVKTAAKALGGDTGGAAAVLNGSQWGNVMAQVNNFANAPLDPATGKIVGTLGQGSGGLTPWEAFSRWLTSPASNLAKGDTKTLQVATATYKPFLDQIAGT